MKKNPHQLESLMAKTAQQEKDSLERSVDHQLLLENIQSQISDLATNSAYREDSKRLSDKSTLDYLLSGGFSPLQWIPFAAVFVALLVSLIALQWNPSSVTSDPTVQVSQNEAIPDWIIEQAGPQEFTKIFTTASTLPGLINDLGAPMENEWQLLKQDARLAMESAFSTLAPTMMLYQPLDSVTRSKEATNNLSDPLNKDSY